MPEDVKKVAIALFCVLSEEMENGADSFVQQVPLSLFILEFQYKAISQLHYLVKKWMPM